MILVNFFYAQPVGHAVEALHYAHGHYAAHPTREISVALNAATAVELADLCPFIQHAYALDHPFVEAATAPANFGDLPREWDWVLDDPRRLSPHTGFGLAALATGTPWLTISGGRWFEYYFNHVPFRSIIPDVERFPCFRQFSPATIVDGHTPSMSDERIAADLGRIVGAATELLAGTVTYDQALTDYFTDLKAATSDIWSIDGVHMSR